MVSKFVAHEEKGEVSSLLVRPERASALLVLGHGAGAGMRHQSLEKVSHALADVGIATFRYQFPFMERGGGRDSRAVTLSTVRAAVARAHQLERDLPLFAGGHSFGGRMTTTAAAEAPLPHVRGLVLLSFPLHPAGRPGTERADHLPGVSVPMLFVSGTRDKLASLDLLAPILRRLENTSHHLLDTADHSYKILKRTRQSNQDVFDEMAGAIRRWCDDRLL